MKITKVKFTTNLQIMGVKGNQSYLSVGEDCDPAWGGGKVTSLEFDHSTQSIAVRKGKRFERANTAERANMPSFDVSLIPMHEVSGACAVDDVAAQTAVPEEKPVEAEAAAKEPEPQAVATQQQPSAERAAQADPPRAQPIQKQGNQQRR